MVKGCVPVLVEKTGGASIFERESLAGSSAHHPEDTTHAKRTTVVSEEPATRRLIRAGRPAAADPARRWHHDSAAISHQASLACGARNRH